MKTMKPVRLFMLGCSIGVATGSAHAGTAFEDYAREARKAVAAVEVSGDRELRKKQKAAESALGDYASDIATLEEQKAQARAGITAADSKIVELQARLEALESSPEYRKAARDVASRSRWGRVFKPDPQAIKDQKKLAEDLDKTRAQLEAFQVAEGRLKGQLAEVRAAQTEAQTSSEAAARAVDAFLSDKKLTEQDGKAVATGDLQLQEARAAAGNLVRGWETEGLDTRLLLSDYQNLKQSGKLTGLQLVALEQQLDRALDQSYIGQYINSKFRTPQFCESVTSCSKPQAVRDEETAKMLEDPWGVGANPSPTASEAGAGGGK